MTVDDHDRPLYVHVLDLPPLYTRPSPAVLQSILTHFELPPPSWDAPTIAAPAPEGFEKWLVSIIASPLRWIADEELIDAIKESASERISERCGRSARGEMKRVFRIPLYSSTPGSSGVSTPSGTNTGTGTNTPSLLEPASVEITLYEPALTADNLGLKTWASSYLLAKRLSILSSTLPHGTALELGAGTGLVGLAAAAVLGVPVVLTDLPEIVPNLARNVAANGGLGLDVKTEVLDWCDHPDEAVSAEKQYELVLAADPLYSSDHPRLLVGMMGKWLKRSENARVVVEMPLRKGYEAERADFKERMGAAGLAVLEEGVETGWDDWGVQGGEVRCWWSVWGWGKERL